jgi:hypothetical protein
VYSVAFASDDTFFASSPDINTIKRYLIRDGSIRFHSNVPFLTATYGHSISASSDGRLITGSYNTSRIPLLFLPKPVETSPIINISIGLLDTVYANAGDDVPNDKYVLSVEDGLNQSLRTSDVSLASSSISGGKYSTLGAGTLTWTLSNGTNTTLITRQLLVQDTTPPSLILTIGEQEILEVEQNDLVPSHKYISTLFDNAVSLTADDVSISNAGIVDGRFATLGTFQASWIVSDNVHEVVVTRTIRVSPRTTRQIPNPPNQSLLSRAGTQSHFSMERRVLSRALSTVRTSVSFNIPSIKTQNGATDSTGRLLRLKAIAARSSYPQNGVAPIGMFSNNNDVRQSLRRARIGR